jgi:hypothetical protein
MGGLASFGMFGNLASDDSQGQFSPSTQRKFGDNAGAYNQMYGQADQANQQYQQGVDNWSQGRQSLSDYLQQQTYNQQMQNVGYQQEDAMRQNKFNQARSGMLGGSADMGAQGKIAQQGIEGQSRAYMAGDEAALNQQQADSAYANNMRQQGYGLYDSANQYGQASAQDQNTMSGSLYDWRRSNFQNSTGATNERNSILGGYLGGVIGGAAGSVGGAAGSYLGNQYKPQNPQTSQQPAYADSTPPPGTNSGYVDGVR